MQVRLPTQVDAVAPGECMAPVQTVIQGAGGALGFLLWFSSGSFAGLANGVAVFSLCFTTIFAFTFVLEYGRAAEFAQQTRLPPHLIDRLAALQPGGYRIRVMVFGFALHSIVGISAIWWALTSPVPLHEGWWSAYAFGPSSAVASMPPERELYLTSVLLFTVVWVGCCTAEATSQCFHLLCTTAWYGDEWLV